MYILFSLYVVSTLLFSYLYRKDRCKSNSGNLGLLFCFFISAIVFYWLPNFLTNESSHTVIFWICQITIITIWNVVRLFTPSFDMYKQDFSNAPRVGPVIFLMIVSVVATAFLSIYIDHGNFLFFLLLVYSSGVIAHIHPPVMTYLLSGRKI